jgi:hypothetical protein
MWAVGAASAWMGENYLVTADTEDGAEVAFA